MFRQAVDEIPFCPTKASVDNQSLNFLFVQVNTKPRSRIQRDISPATINGSGKQDIAEWAGGKAMGKFRDEKVGRSRPNMETGHQVDGCARTQMGCPTDAKHIRKPCNFKRFRYATSTARLRLLSVSGRRRATLRMKRFLRSPWWVSRVVTSKNGLPTPRSYGATHPVWTFLYPI